MGSGFLLQNCNTVFFLNYFRLSSLNYLLLPHPGWGFTVFPFLPPAFPVLVYCSWYSSLCLVIGVLSLPGPALLALDWQAASLP